MPIPNRVAKQMSVCNHKHDVPNNITVFAHGEARTCLQVKDGENVVWVYDAKPKVQGDARPHSRACGFREHEHGPACNSNCPTCGGK